MHPFTRNFRFVTAGTALDRLQHSIGLSRDLSAEVNQWCGHGSGTLPFGEFFQLRPDTPPIFGPKINTPHTAPGREFNSRALFKRNATRLPVSYGCNGHAKDMCQFFTATNHTRCRVQGMFSISNWYFVGLHFRSITRNVLSIKHHVFTQTVLNNTV